MSLKQTHLLWLLIDNNVLNKANWHNLNKFNRTSGSCIYHIKDITVLTVWLSFIAWTDGEQNAEPSGSEAIRDQVGLYRLHYFHFILTAIEPKQLR
jgi:hypothetical protein